MHISTPLNLSLNSGYSELDDSNWPRYYLLDAELKAQQPELQTKEIQINRGAKTIPDDTPYIASWPLLPQQELQAVTDRQLQLGRQASAKLRLLPLSLRVQLLERFGQRLRDKVDYWRSLTIQEGYSYH